MKRRFAKRRLWFVLMALLLPSVAAVGGEGFGLLRKRANLTRIHPPQVRITGSKISIRASSQSKKESAVAERLQSLLESELLGSDPTLRLESKSADVNIDVAVLPSDYSESWESRTESRNVQTGNDEKGRPQYQMRQMTIRYKVVKHLFSVAFKVTDGKTKSSLAADTIRLNFRKDFEEGNGAPDAAGLEEGSVVDVVNDLTRRLTATREIIGVLVPRGRLDDAVPYAEAGMWSKYLEAVERIPQMTKPADESYRQYAMGIAYEALGYGTEELDTALKYLEKAATLYTAAAEANPKEHYFVLDSKSQPSFLGRAQGVASRVVPGMRAKASDDNNKEISSALLAPVARVQSALVQYQKMKEFAEGGSRSVPDRGGAVAGAKSLDATPGDPVMTNDGIIDMLRAGLPESVILTSINAASRTDFDVSPKGLISLAEAKASTKLLEYLQNLAAKKKSSSTATKSKSKKSGR